jgi:hypothetical protein
MSDSGGIYELQHPCGRVYVGSSVAITSRIRRHVRRLKAGKHENRELQRDWHTRPELRVLVLEAPIEREHLLEREQWWLDERRKQGAWLYNAKEAGAPSFNQRPVLERILAHEAAQRAKPPLS